MLFEPAVPGRWKHEGVAADALEGLDVEGPVVHEAVTGTGAELLRRADQEPTTELRNVLADPIHLAVDAAVGPDRAGEEADVVLPKRLGEDLDHLVAVIKGLEVRPELAAHWPPENRSRHLEDWLNLPRHLKLLGVWVVRVSAVDLLVEIFGPTEEIN